MCYVYDMCYITIVMHQIMPGNYSTLLFSRLFGEDDIGEAN